MKALDLFAGPGGWDEGLRPLGIEPLGVEWDENACATRAAAGHPTLQADVAGLDPLDFAGTELLLASPPCQAFSTAGNRKGLEDRERIHRVMDGLSYGIDWRATQGAEASDARAMLVVEPLRFALALRPRFLAFEQVPPVLPLWERMAELLRQAGYDAWTGVLHAEEYGVPQTRRRAILMASLDGPVAPPTPTHHRYNPRDPKAGSVAGDGRLAWVSMADALGWEPTDVVGFPRRARSDRPDEKRRVVVLNGTEYRARDFYLASRPAPILTEKARSWLFVSDAQRNATRRPLDAPAPTIKGGHSRSYFVAGGIGGAGRPRATGAAPAATLTGKGAAYWIEKAEYWGTPDAPKTRVTVEEAAVLQSFPADYPWQGSRSSQFLQVGNAIPPRLARAVVEQLDGASLTAEEAA